MKKGRKVGLLSYKFNNNFPESVSLEIIGSLDVVFLDIVNLSSLS